MNKWFHLILNNICKYLSMLLLKLILVSKSGPGSTLDELRKTNERTDNSYDLGFQLPWPFKRQI